MPIDRKLFFDTIRTTWGPLNQTQVDGTSAVLDAWDKSGLADFRWLAYMLSTVRHEAGKNMIPVAEVGQGRGRAYGKPAGPYGLIYYGRGWVQLTWVDNYTYATKRLEELGFAFGDLVKDPDLLLSVPVSAAVMFYGMVEGWFRKGHALPRYFPEGKVGDWINARNIIDGGLDQASAIAADAKTYCAALGVDPNSLGVAPGTIKAPTSEPPAVEIPPAPEPTQEVVVTLEIGGTKIASLVFDPNGATSASAELTSFLSWLTTAIKGTS
jgi:hypothetical protein